MKFILTLLLLGIIHCGYSQNKTDILLREANSAYNQEEFQESLRLLKQINAKDKSKELVDRLTLMNYHKLLAEEDYPSFTSINQLRDRSGIFMKRYPKSKWLADALEISKEMNTYPKTFSEYEKRRLEEEQRLLKVKHENLLKVIRLSYQNGNYNETLTSIQNARSMGYNSFSVLYYDFLIKHYNLQHASHQNYKDIEELRNLSLALRINSDSTLSEAEMQAIFNIYSKLPKSLEEFKKMEDARQFELKLLEVQQKFNTIDNYYKVSDYTQVISVVNDFSEGSIERMKVTYYQAMSHYKRLVTNKAHTFIDITNVKSALQGYLTKYSDQNLSNTNDIKTALADLFNKYPKTQLAYNAMLKKKEKESQAIIRKANRKMFTSIGYEYGELAPYGLRFETGGRAVGFFATFRYGMKTNSELVEHYSNTGESQPNKTEILLGPNFKLTKWLFFNIGGGYGMYSHLYRNDYANESGVDKTGYIAGYGGITLRAGNVINLIGGASFIDIDRQISNSKLAKPEYTVGITFNIK
ncbi:hypothetical protein [Pedobacter immunditicola]|uniref:hypothetical protein n=1 Tax=Pedobacter immunditicola TaxID=3133440 RepID=UPI0030B28CF8